MNSLPAGIEVCPVQLPGRGTRLSELPYTRLMPLVEATAQALLPHLDRTFALFGHSLGALLSYELAQTLRKKYSLNPARIIVSGHGGPHIPDHHPPLHRLPEAEFLEELLRLNGTPQGVLDNQELRDLLLPILRADFEVCETYLHTPQPPLDCPIAAFGGLRDDDVPRSDLEAWRSYTRASFSLRMFPGDHFFINTDRQLLLQAIARELYQYTGSA
jgi:medium-chain acyl-[acyl-carrier-protein] hydrolase